MERTLLEAALTGDIHRFHQLMTENPLVLHTSSLSSSLNPLHIASAYGHTDFVKEITTLRPDFAKELDEQGYSPIHLASANGHLEVIREVLNHDQKLIHLQGPEKITPLHLAVVKGRVDVVNELVLVSDGDCVGDVNVHGETALHLAVKNGQFEVVRVMVDLIGELRKEEVLNVRDVNGNTVLHLAVWKKHYQIIETLLAIQANTLMEVNAINDSGLSPLDLLLIFPSEAGDREIQEILQKAGAIRSRDLTFSSSTPTPEPDHHQTSVNLPTTPETSISQQSNNVVNYFKFKKGRDSPGEARSTLLVIAVLVATATYQVGVNPPGNVWQDNDPVEGISSKGGLAGKSIWGSVNGIGFGLFMFFNSVGFTLALHMINMLTIKFPLQFELQICMAAMFSTYGTAVGSIAPNNLQLLVILVTTFLPLLVPVTARCFREHSRKLRKAVVNLFTRKNREQN